MAFGPNPKVQFINGGVLTAGSMEDQGQEAAGQTYKSGEALKLVSGALTVLNYATDPGSLLVGFALTDATGTTGYDTTYTPCSVGDKIIINCTTTPTQANLQNSYEFSCSSNVVKLNLSGTTHVNARIDKLITLPVSGAYSTWVEATVVAGS